MLLLLLIFNYEQQDRALVACKPVWTERNVSCAETLSWRCRSKDRSPVFPKPISANPKLTFNLGFYTSLFDSLFGIIFHYYIWSITRYFGRVWIWELGCPSRLLQRIRRSWGSLADLTKGTLSSWVYSAMLVWGRTSTFLFSWLGSLAVSDAQCLRVLVGEESC